MGRRGQSDAHSRRRSTRRCNDSDAVRRERLAVAVTRASVARGEVHLVRLDPTLGSEIKKTRPCLVVSPDELNQYLRTVIIAPMTTRGQAYPWRVACRFQNRSGFVVLDQLRTVDCERLVKRVGRLSAATTTEVLDTLQEMFAE